MHPWRARPHPGLVRVVRPFVRALSRIHPVQLDGLENVPNGPALLVGNHGVLGYESPIFFERILDACGRLPIGLADRWFFRVPVLRDLVVRLGGTYGNMANGVDALRRGELVVVYPGGVREVLKHAKDKYRLLWERSVGFVILAILARVPIIPFAAAGVDDTFDVVGRLPGTGDFLMGDRKYDLPLVWSEVGPLPRPVPLWFRFGEPIVPEQRGVTRAADVEGVRAIHRHVWTETQSLLDGLVGDWSKEAA